MESSAVVTPPSEADKRLLPLMKEGITRPIQEVKIALKSRQLAWKLEDIRRKVFPSDRIVKG